MTHRFLIAVAFHNADPTKLPIEADVARALAESPAAAALGAATGCSVSLWIPNAEEVAEIGPDPLAPEAEEFDCSVCLDGEAVCDTCDECGERHCPECDPCTEDAP